MAMNVLAFIFLSLGVGNSGHAAVARTAEPDSSPGGESGRGWALGLGVVSSPRPYVGADNALFPVPLVQYHRGGFFIEGIRVGYRWGGRRAWRFELYGTPQFAGLDPDDSPFLSGMEERRTSLDGVATLSWHRPHVDLSLGLHSDLLGRNDGQRLRARAGFPFQVGRWRLSPSVGLIWYDDEFVDYYAGVRPEEARPGRPAYKGSSTSNPEAGFTAIWFPGRRWILLIGVDYQRLGSEITDSPIIEDNWIVGGFAGLGFRF
jgi:outer membrane protein